ncbi:hypothetical protein ACLOJK_013959 [Asimina triloba]
MDREQVELQFLGVFGICNEAYKILTTCRKIFSQITVSLILPLSFVFLAHIQISDLIFAKIDRNEEALDTTRMGSARRDQILHQLSSEWAAYLVFKAAYLVLVLVLNLLSTSAVVYTIACLYTAKEMTFLRILSVVPKVWKRLMVTFFWAFIVLLGYNTLAVLLMIFLLVLIGPNAFGFALVFLIFAVYFVGLVYISVVWHLASVVSVLEDVYGFAAMQKSKLLIKGKALIASAIFLMINAMVMAVHVLFAALVVHGEKLGAGARVGYALLFLSLLSVLTLLGLLLQTVIYFVCKSYHHENIDKSCLADHLEVYLGEYVPLTGKSLQMEQIFHPNTKDMYEYDERNRAKSKSLLCFCSSACLGEEFTRIDAAAAVHDSGKKI